MLPLEKYLNSVIELRSSITDNSIKVYAKANVAFFEKIFELKDKMLFALIFKRTL